jgi:putative transposase
VLWVACTGAQWRDSPEFFGGWSSVPCGFSRRSVKGFWHRIFVAMSDNPDFNCPIIDSMIVRSQPLAEA